MKDVNKMILLGRLGADPILRQTKTGTSVAHFSVATARRTSREEIKEGSTEPTFVEETQWHNVVAWGKQGEACATYLKKGSTVYVEGHLRSHQYDDKNGAPKVNFEVQADEVSFLGMKPRAREAIQAAGEPQV